MIKKLSFEHVPPSSCFNSIRQGVYHGYDAIKQHLNKNGKLLIQQRGHGGHTLCEKCNNNTGSWYADDYKNFCYQAAQYVAKAGDNIDIFIPYYIYPNRVLKQIVVMMFSLNTELFQSHNQELVRYVLNPRCGRLPPDCRIFICYNLYASTQRWIGDAKSVNTINGMVIPISDIAYWPFGMVMTQNFPPIDRNLIEISYWDRYGYDELKVMFLKLPVLGSVTPYPGAYFDGKTARKLRHKGVV